MKVAFVNQFARFENLTSYVAGDTEGGVDPYGAPLTGGGYLGDGGGDGGGHGESPPYGGDDAPV